MKCRNTDCPLHGKRMVEPEEPQDGTPVLVLIGEAPGAEEEQVGVPFVGKSGQELDMYLKRFTRVGREHCHITNVVRCRPPGNRDPHKKEVEECTGTWLVPDLHRLKPAVVGAVGRVSTQWVLGRDVLMEKVHGVPQPAPDWDWDLVVVPLYHPAYGLRSHRRMRDIIHDFTVLGDVVRGLYEPVVDNVERDYKLVR